MLSNLEIIGLKNSEDSQIGQGHRPSPIWLSEDFFIHLFPNWTCKLVVLLLINDTVQISLQVTVFCFAVLPSYSSKTFNHVLVLFFHVMSSLPFKFFLQHRKPSALVILVSFAKTQRKVWQFLRKPDVF